MLISREDQCIFLCSKVGGYYYPDDLFKITKYFDYEKLHVIISCTLE